MASPGEILRGLRGARTRAQIAEITGVSAGQIADYENGHRVPTSAAVFEKLQRAYPDLTPEQIWEASGKPTPQPVGRPKGSTKHPPELTVPHLGVVSAGAGIDEEFPAGTRLIVSEMFPEGTVAYTVRGTSMEDALIGDGDHILVRQQPEAERGEIVVVWVPDYGTVVKLKRDGHYASANARQSREPIRAVAECREYGVLVGVIRKVGGTVRTKPKLHKPKNGK
jgi:SOS-response transcriptional repressor LexA